MPIIAIELTDQDAQRLDAIADREHRSRKAQALVLLLESIAATETQADEEL
jgi:predicted transcriptional regulator